MNNTERIMIICGILLLFIAISSTVLTIMTLQDIRNNNKYDYCVRNLDCEQLEKQLNKTRIDTTWKYH